MGKKLDRLRAAAELQKSLRETHGENAEAVLAERAAESSSRSRAETTYRAAMVRNEGVRFRASDAKLPQQVLEPEETVHDVAVGALRSDTFPLLLVTDRRVLHVMEKLRGWTILDQAPAPDVVGAELEKRLMSGRLRVQLRHREHLVMKVSEQVRSEEVAALLRHLAGGGAPPR